MSRPEGEKFTCRIAGATVAGRVCLPLKIQTVHGVQPADPTRLNQINSIAKTNPIYSQAIQRGQEILQVVGL